MQHLFSLNTEHRKVLWPSGATNFIGLWSGSLLWKGKLKIGALLIKLVGKQGTWVVLSIMSCCSWLVAEGMRNLQGCHEQGDKGKKQPRKHHQAPAYNGTGTKKKSWLTAPFCWLVREQEKLLVLHWWSRWETMVHTLVSFLSFERTCIRFLYEKKSGIFLCSHWETSRQVEGAHRGL